MAQGDSFEQVLAQLRRRDDDAASRVFHRFANRLIGLARTRLEPRLLRKVDPEDIVQSVMSSVLVRIGAGQFDLGDWDSLWGLLTRVTVHKCNKWVDHYQAQRRQLKREVGLSAGWEIVDREPHPSEAAALAETLQQVLDGLTDLETEIVRMSLQGDNVREISSRLGCTDSKVYRVLNFVKKRLGAMRDSSAE
jgi:RNA polymerase sigma-70 factor (ECF subfamily)